MGVATKAQILDTAALLNIADYAQVEKDFYAVQTLQAVASVDSPVFELVFSGGTAMTKTMADTQRMSEDIDIKIVLREDALGMSLTQQRKARKELSKTIEAAVNGSDSLTVIDRRARHESGYIRFDVGYPALFLASPALRSSVKLEMVHIEDRLLRPTTQKPVSSFVAQVSNRPPEVMAMPVIDLSVTLAEKMIALSRRTADQVRKPNARADSETLVRHAYDMHVALKEGFDYASLPELMAKVLQRDLAEFGGQHTEFAQAPIDELQLGLDELLSNPQYEEHYQQKLVPLIYHTDRPSWQDIIDSMIAICVLALNPVRALFEARQEIQLKGETAWVLLQREATTRKAERLAPVVAEQSALDQAARAAGQALATHHETPKPKGLFSRKTAKAWEAKRETLIDIASSANRSLREFQRQRQSSGVDVKAHTDARAEVEQRHPQAVKDLVQWRAHQREERTQQLAQSQQRTGPRR